MYSLKHILLFLFLTFNVYAWLIIVTGFAFNLIIAFIVLYIILGLGIQSHHQINKSNN